MKIKHYFTFDITSGGGYMGEYEEPSECPICKHAIKPETLFKKDFIDDTDKWFLSFTYLCRHCFQTFIALHECHLVNNAQQGRKYTSTLKHISPNSFVEKTFSEELTELSPAFVKIYNQALAAQTSSLDEIAGLGYRKAVEFLVKDYCISKNADKGDEIKKTWLTDCISKYIFDERIKTLATRIVWLGNDAAHYVRKFEEHDITTMKSFINALINYIESEVILGDAEAMLPKK